MEGALNSAGIPLISPPGNLTVFKGALLTRKATETKQGCSYLPGLLNSTEIVGKGDSIKKNAHCSALFKSLALISDAESLDSLAAFTVCGKTPDNKSDTL